MSRSGAGTASGATRVERRSRRREGEQERRPGRERDGQRRDDDRGAVGIQVAEDLGEEPRGLTRAVRALQLIPDRRKRLAQIPQELRQHLAHRLRLARQLRQVMPVVNRPLPKPLARMQNRASRRARRWSRSWRRCGRRDPARPSDIGTE